MSNTKDDILRYVASPEGFAQKILGLNDLYPWLIEILRDLEKHKSRISVRTCNGAGKTSRLLTIATLWFMAVYPRSLVINTSGSYRQLRYQLWPELQKYENKFKDSTWRDGNIKFKNGSQYLAFSTDQPGRAEGFHGNPDQLYKLGQHNGPLLVLVDEAKSVPENIFDALERCTEQHFLMASSPGFTEGRFWQSHTRLRQFYKTYRISADMCPHVDADKNALMIKMRGEDDPLVQSKIYANFMGDSVSSIIPLQAVEDNYEKPPAFVDNKDKSAFCDFAGGGDENVLAIKNGNRITIAKAWRERDEMAAIGEFIRLFNKHGLRPNQIAGDNGGAGKPMVNRFRECGWNINGVNNNAKAINSTEYSNIGSEIWWEGRKKIINGEVILPVDDDLLLQLTQRRGKTASNGKLGLESKADMKKRGVGSPDRADAVLGAMANLQTPSTISYLENQSTSYIEELVTNENNENGWNAGF